MLVKSMYKGLCRHIEIRTSICIETTYANNIHNQNKPERFIVHRQNDIIVYQIVGYIARYVTSRHRAASFNYQIKRMVHIALISN